MLGSQAYVKEHFGSFEDPKPGYEKFGGYFNIDSGTGRVRGAGVFGPPEAANILREILEPFKDDGVVGAVASRSRKLGGSDNTSFNQAGLPGIGMGQDPIEYGTHTWHTNLDTYERILEDDVKNGVDRGGDERFIIWRCEMSCCRVSADLKCPSVRQLNRLLHLRRHH